MPYQGKLIALVSLENAEFVTFAELAVAYHVVNNRRHFDLYDKSILLAQTNKVEAQNYLYITILVRTFARLHVLIVLYDVICVYLCAVTMKCTCITCIYRTLTIVASL